MADSGTRVPQAVESWQGFALAGLGRRRVTRGIKDELMAVLYNITILNWERKKSGSKISVRLVTLITVLFHVSPTIR